MWMVSSSEARRIQPNSSVFMEFCTLTDEPQPMPPQRCEEVVENLKDILNQADGMIL
jgi:hypothetical protein